MKTILSILMLVAIYTASAQEVALKFQVATIVSRATPQMIHSSKADQFAYDVLEIMEQSDDDVTTYLEENTWYYGVDVYQDDTQEGVLDMLRTDNVALFRDPQTRSSSISVATDGKKFVVIVVNYN